MGLMGCIKNVIQKLLTSISQVSWLSTVSEMITLQIVAMAVIGFHFARVDRYQVQWSLYCSLRT